MQIKSIQFEEVEGGKLVLIEIYSNGIYRGNRIIGMSEDISASGTFTYFISLYAIGSVRIFRPIKVSYFGGE